MSHFRIACFILFCTCGLLSSPAQTQLSQAPASRIEQLRAEIKRHDDLYYKVAAPEISDTEYDALKRDLRELEASHPELVTPASLTQHIDDDARDVFFQRRAHGAPMLSLDNTYNEAEIRAFDQRVHRQLFDKGISATKLRYTIEPKIDGAGISLIYERGKLTHVLTRGNGSEGDDILANTRAIRELPQQLRDDGDGLPDYIEVRGEIYMAFADFERINAQRETDGQTLFANARNLAAGTMKLHDAAEVASRALHVFVYGIGKCDVSANMKRPITTQHDMLERFRTWGLPVIEKYWEATNADELVGAINTLAAMRPKLAYPIDGAVVKMDDFETQRALGSTVTAPRWAIAYKYTPKSVEARVRAITLQVGRTGILTPVAEFDPVTFGGSTITRATLHNPRELIRKSVRVGDVVVIEKAGDIIPEIVGVKLEARSETDTHAPFVFPKNCPVCDTLLISARANPDDDMRRCPNANCPAQIKGRIAYYAAKTCVNIVGLGDATVDKLVSHGLIRDIADLYELTPEKLITVEGIGEKSATRLCAAINTSRRAELWRVIMGLGIPDTAAMRAKILAKNFSTLKALADADEETLAHVPGIGKKAAASMSAYFANPANRALLTRLANAGLGESK